MNQNEWDAKYREAARGTEPSAIVTELLPLIPRGDALDLACGTGRHALALAVRRQRVTAIDWSSAGLDILEKDARTAKIPIHHVNSAEQIGKSSDRGIDLVHANLERLKLPELSFDLVLCIHYLQRSLFPQLSRTLKKSGMLLFETYTWAQLEFEGGPRNPEHLLMPGELRTAFPELRVVFYRELRAGQGIASLLAQKPENSR